MISASWDLLDPEDENQLHKSRLFSIEEKPFKRITKRLATIHQLANRKIRQPLTPPPEPPPAAAAAPAITTTTTTGDPDDEHAASTASQPAPDFAQLREDITLDFAAYDYTIGRLHFLQAANGAQRARYAAERGQILDTCARVRDNTAALRGQLAAAQATRAQRLAWDALARGILQPEGGGGGGGGKSTTSTTTSTSSSSSSLLQERPKALAGIRKLEEECAVLAAESATYAATWRERREQFSRIMDESMRLRRLIRDEKEEVERREGMGEEDGEGSGEGDAGHTPLPGSVSGNATPRADGAGAVASAVPKDLGEDGAGAQSPAPSVTGDGGLKPPPGNHARAESRAGSRDPSPVRSVAPSEDVEMGEENVSTPQITVEGQAEDKMDIS